MEILLGTLYWNSIDNLELLLKIISKDFSSTKIKKNFVPINIIKNYVLDAYEHLNPFISTWDTRNTSGGSSNSSQIKLPLYNGGDYDFIVDWGDSTIDIITVYNQAEITHTYDSEGIYEIQIKGICKGWKFENLGDKLKITDISRWGCLNIGIEGRNFNGCNNLTVSAIDSLVLTESTSLEYAFESCQALTALNISNTEYITSLAYAFYSCYDLSTINLSEWDVNNCTNFSNAFRSCRSLSSLNLSSWDVSNGNSFSYIFYGCTGLTSINISGWDFAAAIELRSFFDGCTALTSINLDNIDISAIERFPRFFGRCYSLTSLDLSGWDVSHVTNFDSMFIDCSDLVELDLTGWDVSSGTNLLKMFEDCSSLESDTFFIPNDWDITNASISEMFSGCSSLTSLNLSNWTTMGIDDLERIFYQCIALIDLNIDSWNIESVTNFTNMFYGTILNTTSYNAILVSWGAQTVQESMVVDFRDAKFSLNASAVTHKVLTEDKSWTILDGGLETSADHFISSWDTTKLSTGSSNNNQVQMPLSGSSMLNMYISWGDGHYDLISSPTGDNIVHTYDATGTYTITTTEIRNFRFNNAKDKEKIVDISQWGDFSIRLNAIFYGCSNLDVSATDTPILDDFAHDDWSEIFRGCTSLTGLNVTWNMPQNIQSLKAFFRDCTSLTSIDVTDWVASSCIDISYMFFCCNNLANITLTGWNTKYVTDMTCTFQLTAITTLDIKTWKIDSLIKANLFASDVTLTTENYSEILEDWSGESGIEDNVRIHFGNSKYNAAGLIGKNILINNFGWDIDDGGAE